MELQDLVGPHELDAVDFSDEQVKTWGDSFESCNVMRFRLDGKVYTAVEDPNDGYRSSMRELTVGEWAMKNIFSPVKVIGRYRENCSYGGSADILELIDQNSGKTIIEVGTDNTDDYYPSFVANFDPTAISSDDTQVEKQPSKLKGRKLEPKYREPETGKTWAGRGKQPKWMVCDKELYKIDATNRIEEKAIAKAMPFLKAEIEADILKQG